MYRVQVADSFKSIFRRPHHTDKSVDGLRAIAILYVVLFHSFFFANEMFQKKGQFLDFVASVPTWLTWVWHGDKGVDLFFVISGFLIIRFLLKEKTQTGTVAYGRFMRRRLLRILPLYTAIVLLCLLAGAKNSEYFWANLSFTNNFLPYKSMLIPWSWSVTIEMQFYILAPLLIILLGQLERMLPLILMGLFLLTFLVRYLLLAQHPELLGVSLVDMITTQKATGYLYWDTLYVNLYSRAGPFLLGGIVAYLVHNHHSQAKLFMRERPLIIAICLTFAVALLYWVTSLQGVIGANDSVFYKQIYYVAAQNLFGIGVATILLFSLLDEGVGKVFNRVLSAKVWYPISQVSYSIYFFHIPFIGASFYALHTSKVTQLLVIDVFVIYLLAVVFSVIFGIFTFIFIEKPFLRMKQPSKITPELCRQSS